MIMIIIIIINKNDTPTIAINNNIRTLYFLIYILLTIYKRYIGVMGRCMDMLSYAIGIDRSQFWTYT